jgi:hypothetical protein
LSVSRFLICNFLIVRIIVAYQPITQQDKFTCSSYSLYTLFKALRLLQNARGATTKPNYYPDRNRRGKIFTKIRACVILQESLHRGFPACYRVLHLPLCRALLLARKVFYLNHLHYSFFCRLLWSLHRLL